MARRGAVDAAKERMIQLRLRLYLLVFILVWTIPLVHRTLELLHYDPEWLQLTHTATQCSMGWLNCLVYGCNEATLKPYREAFSQLGCSLWSGLQLSPLRPWSWRRRAASVVNSVDPPLLSGTAGAQSPQGGHFLEEPFLAPPASLSPTSSTAGLTGVGVAPLLGQGKTMGGPQDPS
jgi:hypothetical protein